MITELTIRNFKSIQEVTLECKKINIFIGEPNTGKSNLLEVFALLNLFGRDETRYPLTTDDLRFIFRVSSWRQLFYWQDTSRELSISLLLSNGGTNNSYDLKFRYEEGNISVAVSETQQGIAETSPLSYSYTLRADDLHPLSEIEYNRPSFSELQKLAFYRYRVRDDYKILESRFVVPPDAPNLVSLLLENKELRSEVVRLINKYGYRLMIEPPTKTLKIERGIDEDSFIVISLPYSAVSDTLQRMVFNLAIVTCNRDMVIAMEEPEAHVFPYYVKYLAEKIAEDEQGNQFFITTHNPYFLLSVLEKGRTDDVNVFVTHYENFETKVMQLSDEHKEELLD